MQKRQIKEDTKREDLFITSVEKSKSWITHNTRMFVISIVAVLVVAFLGWAYFYYITGKNERTQYALASAIKDFQEFSVSKKPESLPKAEAAFKSLEKESSGGMRDVSQLYLARIAIIKGNTGEAKSIYDRIIKKPANTMTQKLAEAAFKEIPQAK
jgi:hypothetical protein